MEAVIIAAITTFGATMVGIMGLLVRQANKHSMTSADREMIVRIESEVRGVNHRLDTLNGAVAKHGITIASQGERISHQEGLERNRG